MCHVCLLYHNRGMFTEHCQECDQVYYCSPTCKVISMDPVMGAHSKICKALRKLATSNAERHAKSIIKLLLQILLTHWRERQGFPTTYQSHRQLQDAKTKAHLEGSHLSNHDTEDGEPAAIVDSQGHDASGLSEKLQDTLNISDENEDDSEQTGVWPSDHIQMPVENDFYDVLRLQSHVQDWDDEDDKDWNKQANVVLSLLEMSGLNEIASERGGELRPLTVRDLKRLISALECNAFGMFDRLRKKHVCFGRAIFPIASFFNHSCDCNSTVVQADGSQEEVTGEDIVAVIEAENAEKASRDPASAPSRSNPPPSSKSIPEAVSESRTESASVPENPSGDQPTDETGGTEDAEPEKPSAASDPYRDRIGEFRMMTVYAIKDIDKGQDITISYIDTEAPLHARRLALMSDYHFHCCCERCLREEKLPSSTPKKATKDNKGTSGGKKKGKKRR
ncbi:hypothetical protein B0O80DRAFT_301066 [Mortierella sp. GBAus27b]|nr:hypothetical protein B0O80DRAFT_301066 [Mortierella sp. GBAus27b]